MSTIVKTVAGSKLFGATVADSDTDYKFVFLPTAEQIIRQKVADNIQKNTKIGNDKNSADDVDCEGFGLRKFLSMVAAGQTIAVEMLFTPPEFVCESSDLWKEIQRNSYRLVSKQISPFVGYCRAQSSKYCVKAERMDATSKAVMVFASGCSVYGTTARVRDILPSLLELANQSQFVEVQFGSSHPNDNWFSCCGRKVPLTASLKLAMDMYTEVLEDYGQRTRRAIANDSIEWKSLYHAYRIACETNELLLTGRLTFPRPEANMLLKIRNAKLSYAQVSDLIEKEAVMVETNLSKSVLPETADVQWIDDFVFDQYVKIVKEAGF